MKTANEILLEKRRGLDEDWAARQRAKKRREEEGTSGVAGSDEDVAKADKEHSENTAKRKAAQASLKKAQSAAKSLRPPHMLTFKSPSARKKHVTAYNKAQKALKAAESEIKSAWDAEDKSRRMLSAQKRANTKAKKAAAKTAKKAGIEKGSKLYTVGGKKGVWRSTDDGHKVFIPSDGSPPKGNPKVTGRMKKESTVKTANEILLEKRREREGDQLVEATEEDLQDVAVEIQMGV